MPDYYNSQQLAQMLGIAEATITDLQRKGLLEPTVKDGRWFLSSQQAYRLRAAVRWARKHKIDLQDAFAKVEKRWLAQTSSLKD
jgi:phage terminase Nu1 subunit (DNA packaging protein)